jgi:hypothetical protein
LWTLHPPVQLRANQNRPFRDVLVTERSPRCRAVAAADDKSQTHPDEGRVERARRPT